MGRIGEIGHADVQALIAKAAQAAHAAGKPIGIVGGNPDMLGRFLGYGYDWGAVASDLALMSGRAADWVTAIKGRNMGPTTGAGLEKARARATNPGAVPAGASERPTRRASGRGPVEL
jgi:4-hydroxy-2-oxoheptanedioate aldolase